MAHTSDRNDIQSCKNGRHYGNYFTVVTTRKLSRGPEEIEKCQYSKTEKGSNGSAEEIKNFFSMTHTSSNGGKISFFTFPPDPLPPDQ